MNRPPGLCSSLLGVSNSWGGGRATTLGRVQKALGKDAHSISHQRQGKAFSGRTTRVFLFAQKCQTFGDGMLPAHRCSFLLGCGWGQLSSVLPIPGSWCEISAGQGGCVSTSTACSRVRQRRSHTWALVFTFPGGFITFAPNFQRRFNYRICCSAAPEE